MMRKTNETLRGNFIRESEVVLGDTMVYLSCEHHNLPINLAARGGLAYKAESYLYTFRDS